MGGYHVSLPDRAKWAVLERYAVPEAVWIESGTYFGDTAWALARKGNSVHTIEASSSLAARAAHRFRKHPLITVHQGDSEVVLPQVLEEIGSAPVNFWLDGHYSGGLTFRGRRDTPIGGELRAIDRRLERMRSVAVFIDDFRCFGTRGSVASDYPSRDFLVDWARSAGFWWTVEHDVFVAKSNS